MREDTEQEKQLKARIECLEREIVYQRRVIEVLVAVGALTNSQVESAREIVSSFA